ncbi:LacI family transcriptional regulator [Pseudonocardia sp. HH130630-07]|nr:LacI family transcriptional regulator [Pseudonocardia sp. HH130630-07]
MGEGSTNRRSVPRLADVAEQAGVSLASASRSLSGSDGVSESMAAHVREVAARIGYIANVHARTLAGGATSTVGLIVHEIGDPYFSEIASGVIAEADRHRLTVQICHSGRDPGTELRQIRSLVAHRTDAIIVAGSGYVERAQQAEAAAALRSFESSGGRVAVIGRHHLAADAVLPANREAGRAVAAHLLAQGHRRIGVLAGAAALTTVADRLAGVEDALVEAGMAPGALAVHHAAFTRDGGAAAAHELLDARPDLTALLALNDAMAVGALSVLRSRGIGVPTEVSVAGFDDVSFAADLAPGLTTVRLPMAQMGAWALDLAMKPPAARRRTRRTGFELMARGSTGPVRAPS